jgi:hypothetical protein
LCQIFTCAAGREGSGWLVTAPTEGMGIRVGNSIPRSLLALPKQTTAGHAKLKRDFSLCSVVERILNLLKHNIFSNTVLCGVKVPQE